MTKTTNWIFRGVNLKPYVSGIILDAMEHADNPTNPNDLVDSISETLKVAIDEALGEHRETCLDRH